MSTLPTGTVTFLFTDIEGSTTRWEQYPGAMQTALARHDALLSTVITLHRGQVVKSRGEGDSLFAVFGRATDALAAAVTAQRALRNESWPLPEPLTVRMALHTGEAELRDGDYYGAAVNRCARLRAIGHGGQVLVSAATQELVRDQVPDAIELRDLGAHRLRDLIRPEQVYQLAADDLPADFPSLRSLDARPQNLPVQPTALIGRERDVAQLTTVLRGTTRLVTLTGPGGTGKTRLALQVAAELLDDFPDGVFVVQLAPLTDVSLVATTIAQTLGVRDAEGRPVIESLKQFLRSKTLLLVLDNFEQVVDAAALVSDLLASCPAVTVLVTSRVVLHLRGEHDVPVAPLALPDRQRALPITQLSQYAAVALFIQRAQDANPAFEVTNETAPAVAEICCRLDGLPLAIELAAARSRVLTPQAMLSRLEHRLTLLVGGARDLPARQQTLRAAIAWSYNLLSPAEQQLFRRLAVFVGGCTLAAVEAVCNAAGDLTLDVLEGVTALMDQSLLRPEDGPEGAPRFRMLETIREFGWERLAASGESAALRHRHAAVYLALTEEAEQGLRGREQAVWLGRLDAELDNLRAVLAWAAEGGNHAFGLRLATALSWFYSQRGSVGEGRFWLDATLARMAPGDSTPLRAQALMQAGNLAGVQGDLPTARARLDESSTLFRGVGDDRGLCHALAWLALVATQQGDHPVAAAAAAEGLTMSRDLADPWERASALAPLGLAAMFGGDPTTAEARLAESMALYRAVGDRWNLARPLGMLALVALFRGDYAIAHARYEEALLIAREGGDTWMAARILNGLGDVARCEGDYERAGTLYDQSLTLFRAVGDERNSPAMLHNLGAVALVQGDRASARRLHGESLAMHRERGNLAGIAECLSGLAGVAEVEGRPGGAARLVGAAESLREAAGGRIWPTERLDHERIVAAVRAQLDDETYTAAWAAGRALSLEDAIAEATREDTVP